MAGRGVVARKFSKKRSAVILLIGLLLAGLVGWVAVQPLRAIISDRYLARGDAYLESLEYSESAGQYQLALKYAPNPAASAHLALAAQGPTDPAKLRGFFQDHHVESAVARLDQAQRSFSSPKDALSTGAAMYQAGDYAYARYPLETAVAMDPQYAEAWDWLSKDYGELGKIDAAYVQKAHQAVETRDSLTAAYGSE